MKCSICHSEMYLGNICPKCSMPPAKEGAEDRLHPTPCSASSASPENERYLWMQLEDARRERERARAALRDIREGIMNEEENGLWEADVILSIIDRALSPENSSLPNVKHMDPPTLDSAPTETL